MKTIFATFGTRAVKYIVLGFLSACLAGGFLLAQGKVIFGGNHWQRYWGWQPTKPPPLTLPQAYDLVRAKIGPATNGFYCLSASTLEMTNNRFRGWAFAFGDTNGQRARVEISFDKEFRMDPLSQIVLGLKK